MRLQLTAILVSFCFMPCTWAAEAGSGNLASDAGLLVFLQRSDVVMSRVLDTCKDVSVTRSSEKGVKLFRLRATCAIKANPEEDLDCPDYRMDASGTIDNAIQATVRSMKMTLVCTA
ncbi:hypothetical protein [Dyella sp. C9]|uniref:hypothetical protein n=1 Tax=Dyella sp. C9 TaxID=2202154 RepID=UPI000DEEB438|nr:hypothetical protein [Dyella sp. C9]